MKTAVSISAELLSEIMQLTGVDTKPQAVEMALKTFIQLKRQESICAYRGKLHWEGDLNRQREDS
jgi:Arc/MetJ family transcription regulator